MKYQAQDIRVAWKRCERVLDVSTATVRSWCEREDVPHDDNGMAMSALEKLAAAQDIDGRLVRALSVLPRFSTTFSTGEVAKLLECGRDAVVRLVEDGHLQGYRTQHGYRRVTRKALAAYLAENPGPMALDMGLVVPTKQSKPTPRRTKRSAAKTNGATDG